MGAFAFVKKSLALERSVYFFTFNRDKIGLEAFLRSILKIFNLF
jgi:hypothetical protein